MRARLFLALAVLVLLGSLGRAAPVEMETNPVAPVVTDTTRPRQCVIAYLIADVATNDLYLSRHQISASEDQNASHGRYPCPTDVPSRVGARALETCLSRAADHKSCVFGDMARGFENQPDIRLTAENTSRCASDLANYIGIACWKSGERDVCDVGCGKTEQEARDQARGRCEVKQQKHCPITGAAKILPPQ